MKVRAPRGNTSLARPSTAGRSVGRRPRVAYLLAAVALLAAALAAPSAALGAEGALEVLQVGWDGNLVPGTWSPVRVRVVGGGADLNARVEVVLKARYQPGPQAPIVEYPVGAYGQEAALPAGVAKEMTIWVLSDENPMGGGMNGSVRLLAGGRILAEEKVEFKAAKTPYWPLVGALAESPAVARALSLVDLPVQGLPVTLSAARLSAADLPTVAERLRALSGLVIQGNAAATLTGEQRRAVQEWVAGGGHLVLAGGPDAARAASVLPPGALPVTFTGADGAAELAALAGWSRTREPVGPGPVARFKAGAGSLLAGVPDLPLVWRLGLGQGTVTILAADPGLEPLASWAGTPALLRKALEPALANPGESEKMLYLRAQAQDTPMRLMGAVEALPPEAYPDWQTVALILGGFALMVGPLAHLLLWRTDRRGWVWLVVPAAAVLLSASLYYAGVGRGGRDVLVNVVGHVRLDPAAGQARQSLAAGFFAPTHSKLAVGVPGDLPVRVGSRFGPSWFGPGSPAPATAEPPFHVISGRDTTVEFESGQWTLRSVLLVRNLGQEVGQITARLGLEGGLIKGTIQNDTPYPLEDAAVTVGQSLVKLGNLAPSQTAPVTLDPGPPPNPFGGNRFPLSWQLFGRPAADSGGGGKAVAVPMPAPPPGVSMSVRAVPVMPPGMAERLELPQDPEVQRRVRLLDPVLNVPRMGPGVSMLPLAFFGFTRVPVGRDLPGAGDHPTFYLTLFEQSLGLDLSPGPFALPPALIPADIVDQGGGYGGGGNGVISWLQLNGGAMTYGFRPPLPPRARIDALVVTTQQVGPAASWTPGRGGPPVPPSATPGPAEAGVFSVYNWSSASWEPLPAQEQVRLEPASPYLGPDGLVKVQVSAGEGRVVSFLQPELTVEGRVVE